MLQGLAALEAAVVDAAVVGAVRRPDGDGPHDNDVLTVPPYVYDSATTVCLKCDETRRIPSRTDIRLYMMIRKN